MMGGNKRSGAHKAPVVHHSSIPSHFRYLAKTITGRNLSSSSSAASPTPSTLQQSVGFIVPIPPKPPYSPSTKNKEPATASESPIKSRKTSPANAPSTPGKRPISLQTNTSSGYESEVQGCESSDLSTSSDLWKWQSNNLKTKKVYTDWANYYLEKAKCKRHIEDLQSDVTDGVILADVIESVTGQKIPDINRKPKTPLQMIENIKACLDFLSKLGVTFDGISAKDVRDGNLKAIMGICYSLSRHRQKERVPNKEEEFPMRDIKPIHCELPHCKMHHRKSIEELPQSRLPCRGGMSSNGPSAATGIPVPATVNRRTMEKNRQSGSGLQQPTVVNKQCASNSRSGSPTGHQGSLVRPNARNSLTDSTFLKPTLSGSRTSLRAPSVSQLQGSVRSEHSDSAVSLCNDIRNSGINQNSISNGDKSFVQNGIQLKKSYQPARPKVIKTGEKRQGSPKHKKPDSVPLEKVRGVCDGEQKNGMIEEIDVTFTGSDQNKGPRSPSNPRSGIPKPTAAVKGTAIPINNSQSNTNAPQTNNSDEMKYQDGGGKTIEDTENLTEVKPMAPLVIKGLRPSPHLTNTVYYPTKVYQQKILPNNSPQRVNVTDGSNNIILSEDNMLHIMNQYNLVMDSVNPTNTLKKNSPMATPEKIEETPRNHSGVEIKTITELTSEDHLILHDKEQGDGWAGTGSNDAISGGRCARRPGPSLDDCAVGYRSSSEHSPRHREHRSSGGSTIIQNGVKKTKSKMVKDDRGSDKEGKVRGVPNSFGYVKRTNTDAGGNPTSETKTAHVSAVPRTKVKVSGGTQTTSDLAHFKSYSMGGATANQLSQCVRDRLMSFQSLPKTGTTDYNAAAYQHRQQQRQQRQHNQPTDGSLSDTAYSTYSEIQYYYSHNSPYSSWLRNNSVYTASLPTRASKGLVDAESLESLSSLPAQLQHRSSLTHPRLIMRDSRDTSPSMSHRLNRSNSERYAVAQSLSNYPLSPVSSPGQISRANMALYSPAPSHKTSNNTEDDIHGSSNSLVSTGSLYSTPEEKQAHEIRKLKKQLMESQEKVNTLTSQLSTNAHVVSAFEQSLSNMTQRLQHLTGTMEQKDQELIELRRNIAILQQQKAETVVLAATPSLPRKQNSHDTAENGMTRKLSADSVTSVNSLSSACSMNSSANTCPNNAKNKKKIGWLRSSFSKALSRSKRNRNGSVSDAEEFQRTADDAPDGIANAQENSLPSLPSLPMISNPNNGVGQQSPQSLKDSRSNSAFGDHEEGEGNEDVEELKKQLREKDLVLTDIRLEALSSALELESLKDTLIRMRNELLNLKQDNERLQRIVTSKSLTSSQTSVNHLGSLERRFSFHESSLTCLSPLFPTEGEGGKRVLVSVLLGAVYPSRLSNSQDSDVSPSETVIATINIGPRTQWELLDTLVRRVFREYVQRVDPATGLGLTGDAVLSYTLGEAERGPDSSSPELQPCGYLLEPEDTLRICLRGPQHASLDALAFETLIPKSIIQRYMTLLTEHRRIILCGPSGTGKSFLAYKLAEYLVLRSGKESTAESIATFNVDHKNSKELRQYLTNIAEQCETNASDLPEVIILDNLHQATSLSDVFEGFLSVKYSKCPYIIGAMNQATGATTNLQLHHNFRWILCANHVEPVKGFLGRFLRRRFLDSELRQGHHNNDLARVLEWIPRVWLHINKFIELHNSSDVTIGPRLFLFCPGDLDKSQVWFTDLWNYAIVPYVMDAVREGLKLYGQRAPWEDPITYILQTYPWVGDSGHGGPQSLLRIRPEDIGFHVNGATENVKKPSNPTDPEGDPLLDMLMRLQEAANYSSMSGKDTSDSTSKMISQEVKTPESSI